MRYKHSNSCTPTRKTSDNVSIDQFLDSMLTGFLGKDMSPLTHVNSKVNILEYKKSFQVELAVPGWKKSDFNIHLEKNILTIEAKKKDETTDNEEKTEQPKFIRKEFRTQSIKRSFTLPEYVDTDAIAAEYTNGILTISIPKKEEVLLTKKIEIA